MLRSQIQVLTEPSVTPPRVLPNPGPQSAAAAAGHRHMVPLDSVLHAHIHRGERAFGGYDVGHAFDRARNVDVLGEDDPFRLRCLSLRAGGRAKLGRFALRAAHGVDQVAELFLVQYYPSTALRHLALAYCSTFLALP